MCFPMERAVEKKWDFEGLQCIVTRADLADPSRWSQHRCGYVRIPVGHPWHKKDDIPVDVHGGLTFAQIEPCVHDDGVGWWIGFDCRHSGDSGYPPGFEHPIEALRGFDDPSDHYWELDEVQAETERLAKQVLAAVAIAGA
jgi:hypothetical protein